MENLIIFIILAIVIAYGVYACVRRFSGKGSCCGGGSYAAKSRKLRRVAEKKTFLVEDMHCQNCVNRVMEAVQDIPGTSAVVNLKKGSVTVSAEAAVDQAEITARIEKAGYKVTGVAQ